MPRAVPTRKPRRPASRARKNMRLDPALLDAAKQALGADSETEAVTLALRRVVANGRVAAGLRAIGGTRLVDPARVHDEPATR